MKPFVISYLPERRTRRAGRIHKSVEQIMTSLTIGFTFLWRWAGEKCYFDPTWTLRDQPQDPGFVFYLKKTGNLFISMIVIKG